MLTYAQRALQAGSDADARVFLEKKNSIQTKISEVEGRLSVAKQNSQNMKAMHDKLNSQVNDLNAKRNEIKAKIQQAKLQERMNNMTLSTTGQASISKFNDIEAKANAMLDKANAMQELNNANNDGIDDLMAKYDSPSQDTSAVDDELAALKASLGL